MGSLGPTPGCLRQRGSKTTAHAGLPLVAGSGPLGPRPWLFGACARRAESMLTDSGVLGSPPWLFVIFQASRAAAHHTTCTGKGKHLQDHTRPLPAAQEVCVAHHHRRVSVANGQPAPRRCHAPVGDARRKFSHHRAAFSLQAVQAPREGQQCKVERPHQAGTTRLQALAARQWGRPQPSAQGQDPPQECAGGRSAALDSWWLSAYVPWSGDLGWEWSRTKAEAARAKVLQVCLTAQ